MEKMIYTTVGLDNENTKLSLEYYLLEDIYHDIEESKNQYKTFGVEIVKKEYKGNNIINQEIESAKHLSLNKEKVEKLLNDLSTTTVTPIGLHSVLDNIIGVSF